MKKTWWKIESGIWVYGTANLKWHMQMFIDFYGFLHWWKSCPLIKNIIENYYPLTCFLAHKQPDGEFKKLKSWNDLIKSPTSKLSFLSVW